MDMELVLGIDAGTVGIRAALFDLQGQPLGFYDQSYATSYPQPGWGEQHPGDWWDALVIAVRGCLQASGTNGSQIIGLAIDAPCDILLSSQDGTPVTESLMWMDLRATHQAQTLTETHDPILRYCGGDVPAEWPVPKALWLKQHEPALWNSDTHLVEQMSWLTWRLTGEWAVPLNSAAAKWHYRAADNKSAASWPANLLHSGGLEDLAA